jgi:hypothetical protein
MGEREDRNWITYCPIAFSQIGWSVLNCIHLSGNNTEQLTMTTVSTLLLPTVGYVGRECVIYQLPAHFTFLRDKYRFYHLKDSCDDWNTYFSDIFSLLPIIQNVNREITSGLKTQLLDSNTFISLTKLFIWQCT